MQKKIRVSEPVPSLQILNSIGFKKTQKRLPCSHDVDRQQETNLILIISLSFISILVFLAFYQNLGALYNCPPDQFCDLSNFASLSIAILVAFLILKAQNDHREKLARISRSIADIYTYPTDRYTVKYNDAAAKKIVDDLVKKGKFVKNVTLPNKTRAREIKLEKGTLWVPIKDTENSDTKITHHSLDTDSRELLDEIFTENRRVYHRLEWHAADQYSYPIELIADVVKKNTRKLRLHRSKNKTANNKTPPVTYNLIQQNQIKIDVKIDVTIDHHVMALDCHTKDAEQGFYRAHTVLRPKRIISMLFGKINDNDKKKLFMDALKPADAKLQYSE